MALCRALIMPRCSLMHAVRFASAGTCRPTSLCFISVARTIRSLAIVLWFCFLRAPRRFGRVLLVDLGSRSAELRNRGKMQFAIKTYRKGQRGFSILEMMFATIILLLGLVAIAQLVPASILMNSRNRMDSSALVFAQRELDFIIDQPLLLTNFTDPLGVYCYPAGNTCNLGSPNPPNQVQGSPVVVINNQALIDFSNPTGIPNWSFTYPYPNDPNGAAHAVRCAVTAPGNGSTIPIKCFILGTRPQR